MQTTVALASGARLQRENRLSLLASLEESAFSEWLLISLWGFPTLIALHSVGMAVVVGLGLVVSLRLNGLLLAIDGSTIAGLLTIAIWGFTLNLLTGLALFMTRGPEYITAAIFLVKMLFVLASAAILIWLRFRFAPSRPLAAAVAADRPARVWSTIAMALWFGAVVAGRLIAYLSDLYRPSA